MCRGSGPQEDGFSLLVMEDEWDSQGHRQRAMESWVQKVKVRGKLKLGVGGP